MKKKYDEDYVKLKLKEFATIYEEKFKGNKFYFHGYSEIYENKTIEILFSKSHFNHLTGNLKKEKKSTSYIDSFYYKCLTGNLKSHDYQFKEDGTSELKLQIMNNFDLLLKEKLYFGECIQSGVYLSKCLTCAVGKNNLVLGLTNYNNNKTHIPLSLINGNIQHYVEPVYEVYQIEVQNIGKKGLESVMIKQKLMEKAKK